MHPALVYGGDVARSNAWDEGIAFAEKLGAPVWLAPLPERVSFPQDHPLYAGTLPAAIGRLGKALQGHDLVLVIGAPVFRYYPWVPGRFLPSGARLLHITDDRSEAAKAVVGDSLVGDSRLALEELSRHIVRRSRNAVAAKDKKKDQGQGGMRDAGSHVRALDLFQVLSECLPEDYIVVSESPSNMAEFSKTGIGRITKPDSYYMTASGGLGWGMPAAVGLAFAEEHTGRQRPVIGVVGDGSFQFSPQSIWTAVQCGLHVVFVVLQNEEYGILKIFASQADQDNIPGLDILGIDIVSLGKGYGAKACRAETAGQVRECFSRALSQRGVTVIEVPIEIIPEK